MEKVATIFKFCANYAILDLLSLVAIAGRALWGYLTFYRPTKALRNFQIKVHWERVGSDWNFPLRVTFQFTNNTGRGVFISSAYFKCRLLRPDPSASFDTATNKLVLTFPRKQTDGSVLLQDFDFFLPNDSATSSYAPIDVNTTDDEIRQVFKIGRAGTLDCYLTILQRDIKPVVRRIRLSPRINLLPQESVFVTFAKYYLPFFFRGFNSRSERRGNQSI